MADPIVKDQVTEEKKVPDTSVQAWTSGVFGWGEDIFDNEELFQPLDWQIKKKENKEEDFSLDIEEPIDWVSDENEIINNESEIKEEKFDPIFTEEDESENIKIGEIVKEPIEEIPVADVASEILTKEGINEIKKQEEMNEDIPVAINNPVDVNIQETEPEEIPDVEFKEQTTIQGIEEDDDAAVKEDEKTEEIKEEIPVINNNTAATTDIEKEPESEKSDLMKKFLELVNKARELYKIAKMDDGEYVELVGWDTWKSQVIYNLWLIKEDEESDSILISKVETDSESQDQQQNNLQFKDNNWSIEILLDEQLLYDEIEDLQEDQNKKMQVADKLNKFIFLVSEELKIYERDRKEKERMEQERRKLRDIFRNF